MSLDGLARTMNLNFQESKIYALLLALGQISFGEIVQLTEFTPEDTSRSLESLKNMGHVLEVSGITNRYQALIPFKDLETSAKGIITEAEDTTGELDAYIGEKTGVIRNQMNDESQKISKGIIAAQAAVKQAEMKGEGDTEARIARYTLEVEQATDQTKNEIAAIFQSKQSEHSDVLERVKTQFSQSAKQIGDNLHDVNSSLRSKYNEGFTALKEQETLRSSELTAKLQELATSSQAALSKGIENVQSSIAKAGDTLAKSVDDQKNALSSYLVQVSEGVKAKAVQLNEVSGSQVSSSLNTNTENIRQRLESSKTSAVEVLTGAGNSVKDGTTESLQSLKQTLSETLTATQTQLNAMISQAQETLSQLITQVDGTVTQTQNQIQSNLDQYSEKISSEVDTNVQRALTDTTSLHDRSIQEALSSNELARDEVTAAFNAFLESADSTLTEFRAKTQQDISATVATLRGEINSQVGSFSTSMAPQIQILNEEFSKLKSSLSVSQTESLESYLSTLQGMTESVEQRHQETQNHITQAIAALQETIEQTMNQIHQQFVAYDQQYSEALNSSAIKNSEHIIAQTEELKTRTIGVVNELSQATLQTLTGIESLISTGIDAEIAAFEKGFTGFTEKFQEVSRKTDQMFQSYIGSLRQLSTAATTIKRPEVQTAPIFSKAATLDYINQMFNRMKGGLTLLIPDPQEIPIESIMATKNHQRVQVVSIIDPVTHSDILKKLFQKPNVRVRSVDPSRFPGVDRNVAADRDGEEVIIGVVEDSGETVSVASESRAFIQLMGKIVIGGTFLAQSTEINRAQVGM
ncbi:MAG: hypothetical protein ACFFE8_07485 [Candidatus Heimdallarchaeota archaeon]